MSDTQKKLTLPWNGMSLNDRQFQASEWFRQLQHDIINDFEAIEREYGNYTYDDKAVASFDYTPWNYRGEGGGVSGLMRGRVFEKVGVNISVVKGKFPKAFAEKIPGAIDNNGAFFATGISLVAHMRNPHVPAAHMNTRFISTSKEWFGGGGDLNPALPKDDDTAAFHAAFKACCDRHDPEYYPKFKAWCDEYFYMPHRNEHRGVGGIFYDYVDSGDGDADFAFTQDVGRTFRDIYTALIRKHVCDSWTDDDRRELLRKRGRYAEFNLLYDRGTKFGLETGGNTESILMSLPPEVTW